MAQVTALADKDILGLETFTSQLVQDSLPEWLRGVKRAGWDAFQKLPMPSRKDETWRFSDLKVTLDGFHLAAPPSPTLAAELLGRSSLIKKTAGHLAFGDNATLGPTHLSEDLRRQGVIFEPLAEAARRHPDLVSRHLLKIDHHLGGDKFLALHQAYASAGAFLYIPRGLEVELPFVAYHWHCEDGAALFPHTLIVAEDNSRVSLIDFFLSARPDTRGLACGASNVHAGPGAKVFRKSVQNWSRRVESFQMDATRAGRDTDVKNIAANLGAQRARFENQVRITGPGSNVRMYSVSVADRDQEYDQRTLQVHGAPHASSDLLYKNALLDTARTIFYGMIKVEEDAQQTDAFQTNRNLLLSNQAEANSLPGLEIKANDVKCSHGATTGQLDAEELFYLRARGIPKSIAQRLLVFGFFEEIIDHVENEELAEILRTLVHEKFESRRD